jgi:spore coat protein U-like protein
MLIARAILFFNGGKAMKKSRIVLAAITAGVMVMSLKPSFAAAPTSPQQANFTVQANVDDKCSIKTGPATYDFGTYDPTAAIPNDNGSGSAVIKCTKGTAASITFNTPAMSNGTDSLTYSFYQDVGRTTVYGTLVYNAASNADQPVNFYGRINALQDVGTGSYTAIATFNVAY